MITTTTHTIPPRLQRLLIPRPQFGWVNQWDTERGFIESYIAERFEREYGAKLYAYLPSFFTMSCCDRTSAVAGVNSALTASLFLESYLDVPIETKLAKTTGCPQYREGIVEIGNLVASHRGASQLLFLTLAQTLLQAGNEWIVFTATRQVAQLIKKLHCDVLDLGLADPSRLGRHKQNWGSYYAAEPHVCAINLPAALGRAYENLGQSILFHLFKADIARLATAYPHFTRAKVGAC